MCGIIMWAASAELPKLYSPKQLLIRQKFVTQILPTINYGTLNVFQQLL